MPIILKYDNGQEKKIIGTLDPDIKVFSRKVQESKHLYKVLDAWGVDSQYFNDVLYPGGYTLKINDIEKKVHYQVTAEDFAKNATYLHFKTATVDHGAQLFLARKYWTKEPYTAKELTRNKKHIVGKLNKL